MDEFSSVLVAVLVGVFTGYVATILSLESNFIKDCEKTNVTRIGEKVIECKVRQ